MFVLANGKYVFCWWIMSCFYWLVGLFATLFLHMSCSWDTVNHLAMGQTIGRALAHAKDTYGENDIIWYTEQGGRRPHAAAAYQTQQVPPEV